MKNHLLIIDPQNSFCHPQGELYVKGAKEDMERLAGFIEKKADKIDRITVTLDSHNKVHIAHPIWWKDKNGNHPAPFTQIEYDDLVNGIWMAADKAMQKWSEEYLKKTGVNTIWPYHCLIGTKGHNVVSPLLEVLNMWREKYHELDFVCKGTSRFTENFSAVKPSVEVPFDPSTFLNRSLIKSLEESDFIWVAGEASSHCVADTVQDIIRYAEDKKIGKKITLIRDAMSHVEGFEQNAKDFFEKMEKSGAAMSSTKEL